MSDYQRIQCICTNLRMASRISTKVYNRALKPLSINCNQYAILVNISRYQPMYQHELANHLDIDLATISRALLVLKKRGFIEINRGEVKNTRLISLTDQGETITLQALEIWKKTQNQIIEEFGNNEWSDLLSKIEDLKSVLSSFDG